MMSDKIETTPASSPAAGVSAPDKVPARTKFAFGVGALVENLAANSLHQLANPIYNIVLGVNPAVIGAILAFGRLLDALTDPPIGHFSDNFRSRWGRRRPLIVAGALLTGPILLAMFFCPRGWSPLAYSIFFAVSMVILSPALTLFVIPLKGFQYELTRDYHERTRVAAVVAFVMPIGGIMASWLFAATQLSIFDDGVEGARYTAFVLMLVVMGLGVVPALLVKENAYAEAKLQKKFPLRENMVALMKNRPLLLLSCAGLATLVGIFTVYSLGLYLNIYHVHGGNVKVASVLHGAITTAYQIASMAATPVISWAATRIGKRAAFIGCLGVALVGTVAKWFCYTPDAPWLMFIPMVLMGVGMSGFWILTASMIADVSDHAELVQGYRNEASVGAVFMWIHKTGVSVAFLISGFVLVWVGFDEKLGGNQADSTILGMRVLFSFVPAVAILIAIGCVLAFPITEAAARATRNALEQRRKGLA
jgi:glycoside/pentoside/hexuronide:cation symporter, GPH family